MARPYTPTCPADLREAFENAPVMVRARKQRERLADCADGPYSRATTLLRTLDNLLANAEPEWPIITGPAPHCSHLGFFLTHYDAAIDAACWTERYPPAVESRIVPQGKAA